MSCTDVLLVSEEYPPYMFGGIGSVCYDLAHSLSKRGIHTTVLCGRSRTGNVSVEKTNSNLRVIRLPFFDFPPRFLWFQLQNTRVFAQVIKDQSVLHVVNPQAGAAGVYLKKRFGKPMISSIHGVPLLESKVFYNSPMRFWTAGDLSYNLFEYPLNDFFTRLCLANSERIAVCSATTAEEMRTTYSRLQLDNVSVIYNGVNFDKIDRIEPRSAKNGEGTTTILYYGRLYYRKGILEALQAVTSLAQDFHSIRFEIFGRGPLENRIRRLIRKWGLRDVVHLRGHVPYDDLVKEIKTSDMVIMPSLYEAQSVSILEAMACKKPVIAYDFSFSREIIEDMQNGLLAKPGNVEDLTHKMELLIADSDLRQKLGHKAYSHVKSKHNWDLLVDRYIELYEDMVSAGAG